MTGRPPTTVEGEVRRMVRRMGGVHGVMSDADRLTAIHALTRQIDQGTRYGRVPREQLIRLAAQAQAWAEAVDGTIDTSGGGFR